MSTGEELYTSAVRASDLSITEYSGHADILIAAGVMSDGLACMVWRTRAEYDTIGKRLAEQAQDDLTARALALMSLSTLGATKRALAGFAVAQLTIRAREVRRMRFKADPTPGDALDCVPFMLDEILEPFCYRCTGRGTINEFGKPQAICPACSGRQVRRAKKPETDGQAWLLQALMTELERKEAEARRSIRILLDRAGAVPLPRLLRNPA